MERGLTEERITQRHLLNPLHGWIIHKLRVDVEEDRHIHRLPGIQPLLLEAETLDLAEILRDLARRHAVRRHADDILRRIVRRRVERQRRLAREYAHLALLRREAPGQHVGDGPVEGDADALCADDGLEGFGGVVGGAVDGGFDGLAAPAGGLADLEKYKSANCPPPYARKRETHHFVHRHRAVGECHRP